MWERLFKSSWSLLYPAFLHHGHQLNYLRIYRVRYIKYIKIYKNIWNVYIYIYIYTYTTFFCKFCTTLSSVDLKQLIYKLNIVPRSIFSYWKDNVKPIAVIRSIRNKDMEASYWSTFPNIIMIFAVRLGRRWLHRGAASTFPNTCKRQKYLLLLQNYKKGCSVLWTSCFCQVVHGRPTK